MTAEPPVPPSSAPPLLEMRGILKRFPGVLALGGVDLTVRAAEVRQPRLPVEPLGDGADQLGQPPQREDPAGQCGVLVEDEDAVRGLHREHEVGHVEERRREPAAAEAGGVQGGRERGRDLRADRLAVPGVGAGAAELHVTGSERLGQELGGR